MKTRVIITRRNSHQHQAELGNIFYNKEYLLCANLKTIWFLRPVVLSLSLSVSVSLSFSKHTSHRQKHIPSNVRLRFFFHLFLLQKSSFPPTQPQASDILNPEIFSFSMFLPKNLERESAHRSNPNLTPEISVLFLRYEYRMKKVILWNFILEIYLTSLRLSPKFQPIGSNLIVSVSDL